MEKRTRLRLGIQFLCAYSFALLGFLLMSSQKQWLKVQEKTSMAYRGHLHTLPHNQKIAFKHKNLRNSCSSLMLLVIVIGDVFPSVKIIYYYYFVPSHVYKLFWLTFITFLPKLHAKLWIFTQPSWQWDMLCRVAEPELSGTLYMSRQVQGYTKREKLRRYKSILCQGI